MQEKTVTMDLMKVAATRRTEAGKSAARRLRSVEQIPAVAYGRKTPAQPLVVSPKRLLDVLASERGRNTVVEIDVDTGENYPALLCDYQYHPVTRQLLHADFLKISLSAPVDVEVPFETLGKCKGVIAGGNLHVVFRKLPVRCLPDKIPVKISYDVTELELDGHVGAKDLPLPEGAEPSLGSQSDRPGRGKRKGARRRRSRHPRCCRSCRGRDGSGPCRRCASSSRS